MIGLIVVVLCALGANGLDNRPPKIAGKPAELILPHYLKCFRTCMRIVPTSEMKAEINNVMRDCHVPETFVEIQRANLGRNEQKMEKMRFTAYMKDPTDYWCIVSWESVLNTNITKGFQVDCNYECTLSPT